MKKYINNIHKQRRKTDILFTFSFMNLLFAVTGKKNDKIICRCISFSSYRWGVYYSRDCDRETAEEAQQKAEEIWYMLEEQNIAMSGIHINIQTDHNGEHYIIKTKHRYFNLFYMLLPYFTYIYWGVLILINLISNLYLSHSKDWISMYNGRTEISIAQTIITAVSIVMYALTAFINRHKSKTISDYIINSLFCSALLIITFGVLQHISVIIAVILALILIFTFIFVNYRKFRKKYSSKKSMAKICRNMQFCKYVMITAGVFAFIMSWANPIYRNRHISARAEAKTEAAFEEALTYLDDDAWDSAGTKKKKEILQTIVDHEALYNKTYSARVIISEIEQELFYTTYAYYDDTYNVIIVDENYLDDKPTDVLTRILHEYEHARQHYIVKYNEQSPESEIFSQNIKDYHNSERYGYDAYASQPLEANARGYATSRLFNFYKEYVHLFNSDYYSGYLKGEEEDITVSKAEEGPFSFLLCKHNETSPDRESGDFVILTGWSGTERELIIPATLNGYPVRRINSDLLKDCEFIDEIENIFIPATVTAISNGTFSQCTRATMTVDSNNNYYYMDEAVKLIEKNNHRMIWTDGKIEGTVKIPADCVSISFSAFRDTSKITDFYVEPGNPTYKTIDGLLYNHKGGFLLCPASRQGILTIPEGTQTIRKYAFLNCINITEVIIPDTCTEIEENAFATSGITTLTIPPSVKTIAYDAFENMPKLQTLTISPLDVTETADFSFCFISFDACTELENIYFNGTKAEWEKFYLSYDEPLSKPITVHCTDDTTIIDH